MTAAGTGRSTALIGAAMLLGSAAVGVGLETVGRRATEAVSFAVDLRPGVSRSPAFRAAYDEPYEVGLEVDRTLPFKSTECLLGVRETSGPGDVRPGPCGEAPSPVDLEWAVYEGAHVVARGRAEPGQAVAYGETITRWLGEVRLRTGRDYSVEVRSNRDVSALAPARPRITLEVHPMVWKDEWVLRSLGFLAAMGIGAMGACLAVAGGVMWALEKVRAARGSRRAA